MSFKLQRTRVGVLRGGPGHEYDVSLRTGGAILKILREDPDQKYDPVDIFIDKKGGWHINGVVRKPEDIVCSVDLMINALHGPFGEGGYVSRILDSFKTPHTGPSLFAGSLSQNKHMSKEFLKGSGIKSPYHELIKKENFGPQTISETWRSVPMPAIVKPADSGSFYGASIARTPLELAKAFEKAFGISENVMVEEFIPGTEITCGVIRDFRGEPIYALMPTEIIHGEERQARTPGRLSQKIKDAVADAAKKIHDKLNLGPYSRSDFILHPKRGLMFLEVNSLPALHEDSLFNHSLKAVGATPEQFTHHIITISLKNK